MLLPSIGRELSSVVNMLNNRAVTANREDTSGMKTMLRALDNSAQEADEAQAADGDTAQGGMTHAQMVDAGVEQQLTKAETLLDVLQRAADFADLEAHYERLVNEGAGDSVTGQLNERALAFYREMGSAQSMEDYLTMWGGFDFSTVYDNATGGAVSKKTGNILDDLASLSYLGLDNLDQMSAAERKQAILGAMDIVKARLGEHDHTTSKTYVAATERELTILNNRYFTRYATDVVVADAALATSIGKVALADVLAGNSVGRPESLPDQNGETMAYWEYMQSMGVRITGRVDIRA